MGNVLLFFDHRRSARQMARLLGAPEEDVWQHVFVGQPSLNDRCDGGEVHGQAFYDRLCQEFCQKHNRPSEQELFYAASDIFRPNVPMKAIVYQLKAAGCRVGLLSNTCDVHWEFIADGRYRMFPEAFDALALSFRLRQMKPGPDIYASAAKIAGVEPDEIFYADDIAVNVEGAKRAGFDAVLYTSPDALVSDLNDRGVAFNY